MERITSFTIDHDVLVPGFYISRKDGDITTYDLRTRRPNKGDYMSNADMHSVEHMFATYIRNSEIADSIRLQTDSTDLRFTSAAAGASR